MKILLHVWNSYLISDWLAVFQERKTACQIFEWQFADKNRDEVFEWEFDRLVGAKEFDAVMSINYFPLISKMCMKKGIKYIAWCYDNPLNVEQIEETLHHPCNYVFLFDRIQFRNYCLAGFDTVYHLPLGVYAGRLKNLRISLWEEEKYRTEVAFCGNLYDSMLPGLMEPLEEETRGFLNALLDIQSKLYGVYLFDELITEELIEDINRQYLDRNSATKLRVNKAALTFAMASEVTRSERLILLNLLGKRYRTKFYSYDKSEHIKYAEYGGSLDFVTQMPKAFRCAKINLNPSLKCIQSGIPLRALDIMGAGGFLLSNYQQELSELFLDGEDMVMYGSLEEAVEKAGYYLTHEEERQRITESGCRKTLEEHSLEKRLESMFKTVGLT